MKTYLFFGSFNPFHKGHLALAKHILDNTSCDLWFVVSPQNPHKDPAILAPFMHRFAMTEAVAATLGERVKACDIEENMPRPSYTINTIEKLKSVYPERQFTIIAGSDIATTIHTWYRYETLSEMVEIAIYPRMEDERLLCSKEFMDAPILEMSSTEFRNTKNLDTVPPEVATYICSHNLYGL